MVRGSVSGDNVKNKNFVVQFAFRSGSKEDTISLIEALAHSDAHADLRDD